MPVGESVARQWAALGHDVTLQATVAQVAAGRTVALYTLLTAMLCLTGLLWQDFSLVAIFLVVLSAVVDLDGGRGWVRRLVPSRAQYNVVIWPQPGHGPILLVAAPLDTEVPLRQPPSWLLRIPVGLMILSGGGAVLMRTHPELGRPTLFTCAICLGLVGLVALCWRWLADQRLEGINPARSALELAVGQVQRAGLQRLRCAFALIGGDRGHHDGLEILLRNHEHRLRKDGTRVLILQPDHDTLGVVHREGRIRRASADPLLVGALRRLGLGPRRRTTSAARALRAGWRAAAMTVGPEQVHAASAIVAALVKELDEDIVDGSEPR